MSSWTPLGADYTEGFDGLTDGVPVWLSQSLWDWIGPRFLHRVLNQWSKYEDRFNRDKLRHAERILHLSVKYTGIDARSGVQHLKEEVIYQDMELRLVDYLLAEGVPSGIALELNTLLVEAGSLWRVGARMGKTGLERRVPEGVLNAAEHVMDSTGHAGQRLAEAWTAAFGINPNPSIAYSLAIKAVEDATIPKVLPKGKTETLGTVLVHMKATKAWALSFPREHADYPTSDVLIGQMQMLWSGQADRHGGAPDPSLAISQVAAEVAVMTAVPVVWAFSSGAASKPAPA